MGDLEEQKNLVSEEITQQNIPLTCFGATIRVSDKPLILSDLIKIATCVIFLEFVIIVGLSMAGTNSDYTLLCISQIFCKSTFYIIVYTNLLSGGWGAQDTRFWCDIKIMFVRGFNTIRTIWNMISSVLNLWIVAIILDLDTPATLAFIAPLAILAEWQSGLAENLSQEDVKVFDKFLTSAGQLNLESLHYHQMQTNRDSSKNSQPFVISTCLKIYMITCLLSFPKWQHTAGVFGVPIVMTIVAGVYIIPLAIELAYIKKIRTFCQIEIYRTILDMAVPVIIAAFSLV